MTTERAFDWRHLRYQHHRRMSWGTELWDKYEAVLKEVNQSGKELDSWYGGFFKERSKLEAEYARGLRRLVRNYTIKEKYRRDEEETSQARGFRMILEELGYQAGQHELLAETYSTDSSRIIEDHLKTVKTQTKKIKKEAEEIESKMKQVYKQLDKKKVNYAEAHSELENLKIPSENDEKTLSRLELDKKISLINKKTRLLDDAKAQYAHQLLETNNSQREYYAQHQPSVLDSLQTVYVANGELVRSLLTRCLDHECGLMPIISKCQQEMRRVVQSMDAEADASHVVNRLKTGCVPPSDVQFEEYLPGVLVDLKQLPAKRNSLIRVKSKQSLCKGGSVNYYQMKRELEKKIDLQECDLLRGQKEMKSLQLMIQTYRENPKFGDVKKFERELEVAVLRVQQVQASLHCLHTQLEEVNVSLDNLKIAADLTSVSPSQGLMKKTISEKNIQEVSSYDTSNKVSGGLGTKDENENTSDFDEEDYFDSSVSFKSSEPDDISENSSDKRVDTTYGRNRRVSAIYSYSSDSSETISMAEGEEFLVLETDQEGWTKVRRRSRSIYDPRDIGFVPTSFVRTLL